MSDAKKDVPEPSMEEILSSIRRIIAEEDDPGASRAAGGDDPRRVDQAGEDVLELTDRIDDGRPVAPAAPAAREPRPRPTEPPPVVKQAAPPAPLSSDQPAIA